MTIYAYVVGGYSDGQYDTPRLMIAAHNANTLVPVIHVHCNPAAHLGGRRDRATNADWLIKRVAADVGKHQGVALVSALYAAVKRVQGGARPDQLGDIVTLAMPDVVSPYGRPLTQVCDPYLLVRRHRLLMHLGLRNDFAWWTEDDARTYVHRAGEPGWWKHRACLLEEASDVDYGNALVTACMSQFKFDLFATALEEVINV